MRVRARRLRDGVGSLVGAVAVAGSPGPAAPQVVGEGLGGVTPTQVSELRSRSCPQGMEPTTDRLVALYGIPPEEYWTGAVLMDQLRDSPEYQAQFDAAVAQAKSGGANADEVDRAAALMRNDPALALRCQPKGATEAAVPPALPGLLGSPGMTGPGGGDLMQASLTQALTGSLPMLGPAGLLAAAAPVAIPIATKALGGLFGKKPKTPEQLAKDLAKNGELAVDGVGFAEGEAAFSGSDFEARLAAVASALESVDGNFLVFVQPEADKGELPDLELARERLDHVMAQLLAAGVAGERLEPAQERPPNARCAARAKPGAARICLIRRRTTEPLR